MKIFLICSKAFYNKIPNIKSELENNDIQLHFQIAMMHQKPKVYIEEQKNTQNGKPAW